MSEEDYTSGAPDFIVCMIDYCQAKEYFKTREIIFVLLLLNWVEKKKKC